MSRPLTQNLKAFFLLKTKPILKDQIIKKPCVFLWKDNDKNKLIVANKYTFLFCYFKLVYFALLRVPKLGLEHILDPFKTMEDHRHQKYNFQEFPKYKLFIKYNL